MLISRNKRCPHKSPIEKDKTSIHGKKLGTGKWCLNCQGWVEQIEKQ
uniref:Uncharacterized protein n=1 Tax=viral metagenome TaxID=1070528 RepID=A0A6H1ZZ95_9ZZZZ